MPKPGPVRNVSDELIIRHALIELVAAVENMRVPQNAAEAAIQVSITIGPALERARYALKTSPQTLPQKREADHA